MSGGNTIDNGLPTFNLDRRSGFLTTNMLLDREKYLQYMLYIKVSNDPAYKIPQADVGCNADLNDNTIRRVLLTVGDVDDNSPSFGNGDASFMAGRYIPGLYVTLYTL